MVDDEPDLRLLLKLALGGAGFDVAEAATGEDALEAVGDASFDLVLLDVNLPGISGMELLAMWRDAAVLPGLPVLMLTADARPGLDTEAVGSGARGLLTKPIRPADLVDVIEGVLAAHEAPTATVEGL